MASLGSGTFSAVGTSSPWFTVSGPTQAWRGAAISSCVVVEYQHVGNSDPSLIRRTGDVVWDERAIMLSGTPDGGLQYRLTCTVLGDGQTVGWDVGR